MAIGRVGILLKAGGAPVKMTPVSRHPDDAALCGAAHLAPPEALRDADVMLAVDIGGTNMRVGLVELNLPAAPDMSRARVIATERWRHAEDAPSRDAAVERLVAMLRKLEARGMRDGLRLARFVGVGCPGVVLPDGTIERGGQNLPGGGWEGAGFNLPVALGEALAPATGERPLVVMHNDAVVQGLSETPAMGDVKHWGVLTVGTGLGNARFTNNARRRAGS
jgi:predicted NBD/HSP70 family sugar kinase